MIALMVPAVFAFPKYHISAENHSTQSRVENVQESDVLGTMQDIGRIVYYNPIRSSHTLSGTIPNFVVSSTSWSEEDDEALSTLGFFLGDRGKVKRLYKGNAVLFRITLVREKIDLETIMAVGRLFPEMYKDTKFLAALYYLYERFENRSDVLKKIKHSIKNSACFKNPKSSMCPA